MRLALAQINPTVGDLAGNAELIAGAIRRAKQSRADLVVLPELAVCGYPPRDLLLVEGFVDRCAAAARVLGEAETAGITAVIGTPLPTDHGTGVTNSLVVYRDGELVETYDKRLLPTYDVFDEDRYFEQGNRAVVIEAGGWRVGLAICEDLWKGIDAGFANHHQRAADPIAELAGQCHLLAVPSASPFVLHKGKRHREILRHHAREHGLYVASVNQVGGNDDLIFSGHACVFGPDGELIAAARGFEPQVMTLDSDATRMGAVEDPLLEADDEALLFGALTLGIRDYLRKTGFKDAVIGLSGGIDSALTAALAVAALGPEHVTGVSLPSRYSSDGSKSDAIDLADRLDIRCPTVPIEPPHHACTEVLDAAFLELDHRTLGSQRPDVTEENLQSRIRGTIMMAVSNRTGALVLTTGNKSELAVGYCTLYGDMNGGLAVLSDLPKTMVFRLSRWINEHFERCGFARPPIPESTITKPPSAELAPGQLDSDSLPAYDVLDEIVDRHVERWQSADRIIRETGFDEPTVRRICRLIDINEYKRRQAALGLKVTGVAFGPGRRMPIARGWS